MDLMFQSTAHRYDSQISIRNMDKKGPLLLTRFNFNASMDK